MQFQPPDLDLHLKRGVALHQSGQLAEAEAVYREVLKLRKRDATTTHFLAMVVHQRGDTEGALRILERLLKDHPKFAAAHNSRGLMLTALGRARDAVASFDRALAADPAYALAWVNRGHALAMSGAKNEALANYDRAIALRPDDASVYYAKGGVLLELGRAADGHTCYTRALMLRPDFPEALNNRANALEQLGRSDEAIADYRRAVAIAPGFAEAWNNQGVALDRTGRHDDALACFRRAVALRPDVVGAQMNLADALYIEGKRSDALAAVERWLAANPDDMKARIFRLMFQLPILYDTEPEIAERRTAYEGALSDLSARIAAEPRPGRHADAVAVSQPFFLAYQGLPDLELQRRYGGAIARVMADHAPTPPMPAPPGPGERIRVGIVTGFFRQHPVWRIPVQGWVSQLDRSRFEIIGYHTSAWRDAETDVAQAACDRFVQGPLDASAWRARILADAPHVLLYPEVGMDRMSALLAAQRLAPVQCNALGHPDTSGLPTLDYFLSSAEMEPDDGEAHYTERLVRLPGLSIYYEPRDTSDVGLTRGDLGLTLDVPVYWCGQSLYKYLPQYDDIYPRIAREVGACQFAFIAYPLGNHVTEMFRKRLGRAFATLGLDVAEHCVILPRLNGSQFGAAIGQCDVVLDSLDWAGFNSNLESLPHDRPIVTFAGRLMRSRHTAAVMRVMGMHDAIAGSVGEYIAKAVRFGRDPEMRMAEGRRIAASKQHVYRDRAPIEALERLLEQAVRTGNQTG